VRGDFRRDAALGRLISIPCTQEVINRAVGVADSAASAARPGILRSLDAIQVATALVVGAKTMVATDVRLREAASRNGLKLIPR
jgi:predicted nucleic acid-binding protein